MRFLINMGDSLFDIFGDLTTRQTLKNVTRQPLINNENMGKTVITSRVKPNELTKPAPEISGELKKTVGPKKSFLCNTGQALQGTPVRQALTPRALNVGSLIYSDKTEDCLHFSLQELKFTKPLMKFQHDAYDYFDDIQNNNLHQYGSSPERSVQPNTPQPNIGRPTLEYLNSSYENDFFTDDFSKDTFPDFEGGNISIPDIDLTL